MYNTKTLMIIYDILKENFKFSFLSLILAIIGTTYIIKYHKKIIGVAIKTGKYLHYIAIKKEFRGKGIGTKTLKKLNIRKLRVNINNTKAIKLYKELGFKIRFTHIMPTGLQHYMTK